MARKGKRITAYIDELDYNYLQGVADETDESTSILIRCAIHNFLVDHYSFDDQVKAAGKLPGYYRL